ncbi:hypothetical protein DMP06_01740 [Slackia equolifaciens]|uniref:PucR C-terminal helix-turn-helix domain-containing protein n=1 Tax=Slackia equolifaciens TaxID=498718 RepID=A0A3N0B5I6_9ACTN|nr:helix-turn-helix domain-containing protein [Slackia equolifaciens]RNL42150.1 hypothetical protein DMP06_01740 [Slackia equolifaciens]
MEIGRIVEQLGDFGLIPLNTREAPAYIETHKMIKPRQERFFPACLYVGYATELPWSFGRDAEANLVCIDDGEIPSDFLENERVNLYLAPRNTNQFDILNRVADIMIDEASVVAGMRRILDVLYRGEGLQSLVDTAADVLGNAVFVNDPAFKILAMSSNEMFRNETLELEKTLGYVHMDNVEAMRRDGVLKGRVMGRRGIARVSRSDPPENWLFKNIVLHGVVIATIAVVDNHQPFRDYHEELVDRFANLVAIELEKSDFFKDDESVAHNYFLGDLLSKKVLSKKAIEQRCRIIKWDTLDWFRVLVVADKRSGLSPARVQQLSRQMKRFLPRAKWTILQNNIVLLLTSRSRAVWTEGEEAELVSFLDENDLYCGSSQSFDTLVDTRRNYRQAYHAVDTGLQLRGETRLFSYERMIPSYVLQMALRRNDLADMRPESAAVIEEYDAHNSGELLKTLEAYLRHTNDPVAAARELNVHRNTLLYRINKIKELTGIDLHDGDARLGLQLYFKARDILWSGRALHSVDQG